jgi:uncharacterized protein (TIGR02466 family)
MIEYWFPVATWTKDIDSLKNKIPKYIDRAYEIKQKVTPSTNWICDTYTTINTNYKMMEDPTFFDLLAECNYQVKEFARYHGVNRAKPHLDDCWLNIAPPGEYQEFHTHQGSHFSLVYYLKVKPNCGQIAFKGIIETTNMYPPPFDVSNSLNIGVFKIEPKESRMLIFPSHLQHMVEKNKSDEDRISIAMNYSFK